MKNKLVLYLLFAGIYVFTFYFLQFSEDKRRHEITLNAHEHGCLNFADNYCLTLKEPANHSCREYALDFCEKDAKAFMKWLLTK